MKRLWIGMAALAVPLCALLAALAALLDSPRGLRLIVDAAQRASNGAIRIGSAEGVLLGEFALRDVEYRGADGTQAQLARLHLRWHPRELLAGRVHVERLDVETLKLGLPPPAPVSKTTQALKFPTRPPIGVIVDTASLRGFELDQAGAAPFKLEAAQFSGRWIGDRVEIARLASALPETGPLQLDGAAVLSSDQIRIERLRLSGPGEIEAHGTFGVNEAKSDLQLAFKELRYPL